ncbi:MAG: hypothetical protein J5621_07430 [Paludibacteraceae bacterium]|nr:hypothetical protein [Paludibacteraceae bacterium]
MKKFFAYVCMAMTVVLMASCMGGGDSKRYESGGDMPQIDTDKCTVNGRHYDNKKEKCWKVTSTTKVSALGLNIEAKDKVTYEWSTEFTLVCTMEEAMWLAAQTGDLASASYSYVAVSAKDSESCYNLGSSDK